MNTNNSALKRIMRETQEIKQDSSPDYTAFPLEDNMFEWHFTIRGAQDTEFEGGIYHGRILLPPDYPFKPPNIVLLTPNGRFSVDVKICLSISAHHPETWMPSWSIRTVLVALIGFMMTEGKGAVGSLDYTKEERIVLAKRSLDWKCAKCGVHNRTALPNVQPTSNQSNTNATTSTTTTTTTTSTTATATPAAASHLIPTEDKITDEDDPSMDGTQHAHVHSPDTHVDTAHPSSSSSSLHTQVEPTTTSTTTSTTSIESNPEQQQQQATLVHRTNAVAHDEDVVVAEAQVQGAPDQAAAVAAAVVVETKPNVVRPPPTRITSITRQSTAFIDTAIVVLFLLISYLVYKRVATVTSE
ncbi:hypothetical protein SAMD00019534_081980 [Acytostelium subglobosum LB1]|uniref:hypothetical protein n=1 Tax=Acytostelium subglobosum LB1 TaxID=1410327 RepID=UPI000644C8EE|nr:hypothetical protein SAMD00019534_081980 [Acytostelium subglobosum LB1]GAM25023.1 hypothetical protein SAMD00019534_081980 [Acytostelium subglobosum LB1]|eukprot:XP_012752112.1 hypothetical protein SAMD00019534_081980 [Acytostelium subglobosum LB1]